MANDTDYVCHGNAASGVKWMFVGKVPIAGTNNPDDPWFLNQVLTVRLKSYSMSSMSNKVAVTVFPRPSYK